VSDHVKDMSKRFMADLPKAENQRFGSPAVPTLSTTRWPVSLPATSLRKPLWCRLQAATDKALGK